MNSSVWQGSVTVVVSLHGPGFPSDGEWDAHMAASSRARALSGEAPFRILVLSDGGGPTSAQRSRLAERPGRRPTRGALVTSSRMAAGIGAVMSLVYPGVKIFAPHDFARALAHLDIPHDDLPSLVAHIRVADAPLGLEAVAEALTHAGRAG
jgi:hypothetical protein